MITSSAAYVVLKSCYMIGQKDCHQGSTGPTRTIKHMFNLTHSYCLKYYFTALFRHSTLPRKRTLRTELKSFEDNMHGCHLGTVAVLSCFTFLLTFIMRAIINVNRK